MGVVGVGVARRVLPFLDLFFSRQHVKIDIFGHLLGWLSFFFRLALY